MDIHNPDHNAERATCEKEPTRPNHLENEQLNELKKVTRSIAFEICRTTETRYTDQRLTKRILLTFFIELLSLCYNFLTNFSFSH